MRRWPPPSPGRSGSSPSRWPPTRSSSRSPRRYWTPTRHAPRARGRRASTPGRSPARGTSSTPRPTTWSARKSWKRSPASPASSWPGSSAPPSARAPTATHCCGVSTGCARGWAPARRPRRSRSGFADQAHMSRHFKAAFGLAPARYQRLEARLATATTSSVGSTGLGMCMLYPAESVRRRSSTRPYAVSAIAGMRASAGSSSPRTRRINV
jgi:hypothetical protein